MAKKKKLTDKQELFCQEYIKDFNATRSAKAAGYSERTAQVLGSETLANPLVTERIKELMSDRMERTQVSQDKVVQELSRIAFGGLSQFVKVGNDGLPRIDFTNATPEDIDTLTEVTTKEYREGRGDDAQEIIEAKVKRADRMKALELLGKHVGMFMEKSEPRTDITIKIVEADESKA